MTRGRLSGWLCASLLTACGLAQAQALPAGAADCLSRLEQADDAGSASVIRKPVPLGKACPEFAKTLDDSAWGASFTGKGVADLTLVELRQLIDLARRYAAAPAAGQRLAAADLGRIVAGLEPFDPLPKQSLWDRFLAKLRRWLGLGDRAGDGWLANWLRRLSIPPSWIRVIVYLLVALPVAGAAAVLLNELRRAGVFGRQARRKDSPAKDSGSKDRGAAAALALEAVRQAPPARQPGLLFALVAARLRASFGEGVRDSATHREIVRTAGSFGLVSAGPLGSVASAAEGATFGGRLPPAEQLESVLADGAAVLRELDERSGRA